MSDREPEAWGSTARGPFVVIERPRGTVEIWTLGSDRFAVRGPRYEQIVAGYDAAVEVAEELARRLD